MMFGLLVIVVVVVVVVVVVTFVLVALHERLIQWVTSDKPEDCAWLTAYGLQMGGSEKTV